MAETPDIETSSADYARRFDGPAGKYLLEMQERAIGAVLAELPPGTALDVGGGHGQLVDLLQSRGWKVTVHGTDRACEDNLRDLHGKRDCDYVQGELFALPAADRSYDLVIAVRLISHVTDWKRLVAEMCRVARQTVVLDYPSTFALNALTPLLFGLKKSLEGNTRTYGSFSKGELAAEFAKHGFRYARQVKQFFLPMVIHRVARGAAPLRGAETLFRASRLTAFAGSPVIAQLERARSMRILLVAPQPFYQERGTPMAVRLLAATLCEFGHEVDLLVYHAGADVSMPGLRVIRAWRPPGVRDVPIGVSWQKIVCDVSLVIRMLMLLARRQYDVIHAVEEAIFPAALFSAFSRRKVVYDMDSSLSDQVTDKWRRLKPLHGLLQSIERLAVRRSTAVFAVCEDLAVKVRPWIDEQRVFVLPDVPVPDAEPVGIIESLRAATAADTVIALYVGNLERYQGIDLLLDAITGVSPETNLQTIVIGGDLARVKHYRQRALDLGISARVRFLGARPVAHLNAYLAQADILVSPRILGQNTPMKVYSYMQSGKAIVATDIRSHSQVLNSRCAELVAPDPAALAAGLERLAVDPDLRRRLGRAARVTAEQEYSLPVFRRKLQDAYAKVASA